MPMMPEDENRLALKSDSYVSKEWLFNKLLMDRSRILVLDCRSPREYGESHIRQAVNFSFTTIMLRRLAVGKIDLVSTIRCRELKEKILNAYKNSIFVVYGDMIDQDRNVGSNDAVHVLIRRLQKDGCQAVCLQEGFKQFRLAYPEWCESYSLLESPGSGSDLSGSDPNVTVPLIGMEELTISSSVVSSGRTKTPALPSSSTEESSSDSEHLDTGFDDDRDFPSEIVPYLYLGNAANSVDLEALSRHGIQYILNVTPDLPNKFEEVENMKYMQIPITDHWSQNLADFFPEAIQFIEEGRSQKIGVLVHCLAGVSRSVTITVAYLMAQRKMSLNEAFSLVRSRKSNVGPNFFFMEQLLEFERELAKGREGDVTGASVASAASSPRSALSATTTSTSSMVGSAQSSIESADGSSSGLGGSGLGGSGGDESGVSSAASSADRRCPLCGAPQSSNVCPNCPAAAAAQFLSPTGVFGLSPDSGIEFDRWTPGLGE